MLFQLHFQYPEVREVEITNSLANLQVFNKSHFGAYLFPFFSFLFFFLVKKWINKIDRKWVCADEGPFHRWAIHKTAILVIHWSFSPLQNKKSVLPRLTALCCGDTQSQYKVIKMLLLPGNGFKHLRCLVLINHLMQNQALYLFIEVISLTSFVLLSYDSIFHNVVPAVLLISRCSCVLK